MNKAVIFLLVSTMLGFAASQTREGTERFSCTASGDPHWKTFDGALHDFQGLGLYRQMVSPWINIDSQTMYFRPTAKVTCVRSSTIEIKASAGDVLTTLTIKWGRWTTEVDQLVVSINGVFNTPVNVTATPQTLTFLNDAVTVFASTTRVQIQGRNVMFSGTPSSFDITLGLYHLAVVVPSNFAGVTNGLCGKLDRDVSNDFSDEAGTNYYPKYVSGRLNPVNDWGAKFAVGGSSIYQPLMHHFHSAEHPLMETLEVPVAVVPTPEEQAVINKVDFQDMEEFAKWQAKCKSFQIDNKATFENCVYDATVLKEFQLAATNAEADANVAESLGSSESSSSKLNSRAAVGLGVGLGVAALVAVIVAGFLYFRLKNVQQAHSRALIALSDARGASHTSTDNIPLHENI